MWPIRNQSRDETETRELGANATLPVKPWRRGVTLRVERGIVLVTQAGDPTDHILTGGEAIHLPPGGLVVTWALEPARLTLARGQAPTQGRERRLLERHRPALARR